MLAEQGASPITAALAPQLGLACLQAASRLAGDDAAALRPAVAGAFSRVVALTA